MSIDHVPILVSRVGLNPPPRKKAVSANIKHSRYTSIKHPISGESTTVAKGCMYIMFDIVDTVFNYERALIVCLFLQEFSNVKETSLHKI